LFPQSCFLVWFVFSWCLLCLFVRVVSVFVFVLLLASFSFFGGRMFLFFSFSLVHVLVLVAFGRFLDFVYLFPLPFCCVVGCCLYFCVSILFPCVSFVYCVFLWLRFGFFFSILFPDVCFVLLMFLWLCFGFFFRCVSDFFSGAFRIFFCTSPCRCLFLFFSSCPSSGSLWSVAGFCCGVSFPFFGFVFVLYCSCFFVCVVSCVLLVSCVSLRFFFGQTSLLFGFWWDESLSFGSIRCVFAQVVDP